MDRPQTLNLIMSMSPQFKENEEEMEGINIEYSDNNATNVLIDILGKDNINNKSQELGLNETRLNRKMMHWDGTENYINAEDTEFILKGLLLSTHILFIFS